MAGADPLVSRGIAEPAQSVRLLKAPGDALRFRWVARVGAPGHFVLERPDGSQVWTAATVGRTAYEAAPPALSGEYELRYRNASGNERVLAHVLVACVSVDRDTPAPLMFRTGPLKAETATSPRIPAPARLESSSHTAHQRLVSAVRPPPTPPPRARA
jgi:hypothetical protein